MEKYTQRLHEDFNDDPEDLPDTFLLSKSNCDTLRLNSDQCSVPKPLNPSLLSTFSWQSVGRVKLDLAKLERDRWSSL